MRSIALILCLALSILVTAQTRDTAFIKTHAIPISDIKDLDESVYSSLSSYRVILIGEIHGSAEPAALVEGITGLFLKHRRRVVIGMEISAQCMQEFVDTATAEGLAKAQFFLSAQKIGDGRASEAWANLLLHFKGADVSYRFFDETKVQIEHDIDRDSAMYENINSILNTDREAVFIGLCGNYHNRLDTPDGHRSIAWYLSHSPNGTLKDISKLLCLNIIFDKGSYNANISEGNNSGPTGLRIHTYAKGQSGIFGSAVNFDNYLLMGPVYDGYNGIVFTRTLHASPVWLTTKKQ